LGGNAKIESRIARGGLSEAAGISGEGLGSIKLSCSGESDGTLLLKIVVMGLTPTAYTLKSHESKID
jgi:hypothetical protein